MAALEPKGGRALEQKTREIVTASVIRQRPARAKKDPLKLSANQNRHVENVARNHHLLPWVDAWHNSLIQTHQHPATDGVFKGIDYHGLL